MRRQMAQLMTKFIWLFPYWEMESLINSWSASETIWKEKLLGKIFLKRIYLIIASFKCSLWNHHFISVLFNMSAWTTSNQYKDVLSTKSGTWAILNIYWLGQKKKCNCKLNVLHYNARWHYNLLQLPKRKRIKESLPVKIILRIWQPQSWKEPETSFGQSPCFSYKWN